MYSLGTPLFRFLNTPLDIGNRAPSCNALAICLGALFSDRMERDTNILELFFDNAALCSAQMYC